MPQSIVKDADAGAAKPQRAVQNRTPARGDVTGSNMQAAQAAQAQTAAELAYEQELIAREQEAAKRNTTVQIDYTGSDTVLDTPEIDDTSERVVFRAKAGAEDLTYGLELDNDGNVRHGKPRTFHFVEGQRYEVPRDLYEHMDSRNLVWH